MRGSLDRIVRRLRRLDIDEDYEIRGLCILTLGAEERRNLSFLGF